MIDDWWLIYEFKKFTKPKNWNKNKRKKTTKFWKYIENFLGWRKRVLKVFEPNYFQKQGRGVGSSLDLDKRLKILSF